MDRRTARRIDVWTDRWMRRLTDGIMDRRTDGWTDIQTNRQTEVHTDRNMNGRTDILYFHSGDLTPWPAATCAARNFGPRKLLSKSDADDRTERLRKIET